MKRVRPLSGSSLFFTQPGKSGPLLVPLWRCLVSFLGVTPHTLLNTRPSSFPPSRFSVPLSFSHSASTGLPPRSFRKAMASLRTCHPSVLSSAPSVGHFLVPFFSSPLVHASFSRSLPACFLPSLWSRLSLSFSSCILSDLSRIVSQRDTPIETHTLVDLPPY